MTAAAKHENLFQKVERLQKDMGLNNAELIEAIGIGTGTFYDWKKDHENLSDASDKKIRDWADNPVAKPVAKKLNKAKAQKSIKTPIVSVELLLALDEMSQEDVSFAVNILSLADVPSLDLEGFKELIKLREVNVSGVEFVSMVMDLIGLKLVDSDLLKKLSEFCSPSKD